MKQNKNQKSTSHKGLNNKNQKQIVQMSEARLKFLKYSRLVILLSILLLIFYPPYLRGVYFEKDQLSTEIFVFAVFALFWVYKFIKNDRKFITSAIDYLLFAVMIIYFISIFAAAGPRLAMLEWLKYCMYLAFFIIISELVKDLRTRSIILWTVVFSGLGVCLLGFDAAGGGWIVNGFNNLFETKGINFQFVDMFLIGRIYSTFGYPDTLAAYLLSIFILLQGLSKNIHRNYFQILASCIGYVLFLTILFTRSRGGILLAPVVMLLFMLFVSKGNRLKAMAGMLVSAVPAVLIFASGKLAAYMTGQTGNEVKVFGLIFAGVVFTALLHVGVAYCEKLLGRINRKVMISSILGLTVIILVGGIAVITAKGPLEMSHPASVDRSVELKADNNYDLVVKMEARSNSVDQPPYTITIQNFDEKAILFGNATYLMANQGKPTNGIEEIRVKFTVPKGSKYQTINFANSIEGTYVKFISAKVVKSGTNNVVKQIPLRFKFTSTDVLSKISLLKYDNSVYSRLTFYKDAFNIFKDHWLIGAGGNAWQLLYTSYQKYNYPSNEPHSYIAQVMVETGIIGLLAICFLIATIILLYIRIIRKRMNNAHIAAVLAASLAIFLHSLIDLDLSLSAVAMLFWLLLAVFSVEYKNIVKEIGGELKGGRSKFISAYLGINEMKLRPMLLLLVAVGLLSIPICFKQAIHIEQKSYEAAQNKDLDQAIKYMKTAASLDPFKAESKIDLANLYAGKKEITKEDISNSEKYIKKAEKLGKYNSKNCSDIGIYYLRRGNMDKGLSYIERTTELSPMRPEVWEQEANTYAQVIGYLTNKNDIASAMKYTDRFMKIYNAAKEVNLGKLVPLTFNSTTVDYIALEKYFKDFYGKSQNIDLNKVAFYNIPDMDVDNNNVPDQWSTETPENINFLLQKDMLTVEPKGDGAASIQTKLINFQRDMEYTVEIELANGEKINDIPFSVNWDKTVYKAEKAGNNIYMATFSTQKGGSDTFQGYMSFNIPQRYEIKSLRLIKLF